MVYSLSMKKRIKKASEKTYRYDEAEPVSEEILALYTWGVFKYKRSFIANTYFKDRSYPTLVTGNLSKADAEKLAAEKGK